MLAGHERRPEIDVTNFGVTAYLYLCLDNRPLLFRIVRLELETLVEWPSILLSLVLHQGFQHLLPLLTVADHITAVELLLSSQTETDSYLDLASPTTVRL